MDELKSTDGSNFDEKRNEKTIEFKMPSEDNEKKKGPQMEVGPGEFWAADENNTSTDPEIISAKLDSKNNPIKDVPQKPAPSPREQELIDKFKDSLDPIIEDLIKKYCKEKVEQVAWEVIPDLAENLIQEELKELSKSVLDPKTAQG